MKDRAQLMVETGKAEDLNAKEKCEQEKDSTVRYQKFLNQQVWDNNFFIFQ